ncbi:MAG TPA: hypothetical protein PLD20_13225 [Blastocatellia bacterium]|nr:hypothetical protein [Blastocatellia bacterium]HMY75868.1 hypothetical protein [Blastocatellia bacterium]HMZ18891.1 hypothetical protein [Blastocatellia bacterium]HNG29627.1 hypothetical protein [Blastocatellia bacterium]
MKRIAFLSVCFVFAALTLALAADPSGKWVAQVPGREGQTQETTITLKAEGDKLTGSISGRQGDTAISDGKVSGDNISFNVVREFNGNTIKMVYTGKLSGDEIKFTRKVEGADRPPVEFTAKRAK